MLYEANEKYTDSIVYKEAPRYISNSLDSLKFVRLENLKEGKYKLIALKDVNGNNKFDPKTDKIGFQKNFITIPNDTLYPIKLFKEELPFKALNVAQASGSMLTMGYQGKSEGLKIDIKKGSKDIPFKLTQFPKKDSVQIWHKAIKEDTLTITVSKNN